MNASGLPFDDIRTLLKSLPGPDCHAAASAKERNHQIAQIGGSLGQLNEYCEFLAGWSGHSPTVVRPLVALFAGSHDESVNRSSRSVADEVSNISAGGAAINQICATNDLGLKVFDLALQIPVGDITKGAALEERDCAATIAFGMEAIAGGTDLLCLGAVEINNSISAGCVLSVLFDEQSQEWTFEEPCEKMDDENSKLATINTALAYHNGQSNDPLEILRQFGGREMAALCGAILAARVQHIPVILDGYTALTSAAVLNALSDNAIDHCVIGHVGDGAAIEKLAEKLELPQILKLGISAGNGCGAALAAGILKSAAQIHAETHVQADG